MTPQEWGKLFEALAKKAPAPPMLQGGKKQIIEYPLGPLTAAEQDPNKSTISYTIEGLEPNTQYKWSVKNPGITWVAGDQFLSVAQCYPSPFVEMEDSCPPGGPEDAAATRALAEKCVPWMAVRLERELIGRQLLRL